MHLDHSLRILAIDVRKGFSLQVLLLEEGHDHNNLGQQRKCLARHRDGHFSLQLFGKQQQIV